MLKINLDKMISKCRFFLVNPLHVLSGDENHPGTSRMSSQGQLLHHRKDSARP